MRNLLSGLVLGLGSLLTPAIALADPVVVLPPAAVHVGGPNFRVDVTPAGVRGQVGQVRFGQPAVMQPPPPAYVPAPVPAPQGWSYTGRRYDGMERRRYEVSMFGAQLRREVAEVERSMYFDVQRGLLRPEVMRALEVGREEVENDFARASMKGFLTFEDRAHLEGHVAELRSLREQFRCHPGRGFGRQGYDRDHDGWNDFRR